MAPKTNLTGIPRLLITLCRYLLTELSQVFTHGSYSFMIASTASTASASFSKLSLSSSEPPATGLVPSTKRPSLHSHLLSIQNLTHYLIPIHCTLLLAAVSCWPQRYKPCTEIVDFSSFHSSLVRFLSSSIVKTVCAQLRPHKPQVSSVFAMVQSVRLASRTRQTIQGSLQDRRMALV